MSNVIIVFGHSDDLIEVKGAACEEFGAYMAEDTSVRLGDQYKLTVTYDKDGVWRIDLPDADDHERVIDQMVTEPGELSLFPDYSEVAIIDFMSAPTTAHLG